MQSAIKPKAARFVRAMASVRFIVISKLLLPLAVNIPEAANGRNGILGAAGDGTNFARQWH
jgi:hypothetical protein